MRPGYRKLLIWLAALAGTAASLFYVFDNYADQILTGIADNYIKKELCKTDSLSLNYSNLDYSLATGRIKVKDIEFSYLPKNIEGSCKSLELGPLKPRQVWREKQVALDYVRIREPKLSVRLKPDRKEKDSVQVKEVSESGIVKYIKKIGVKRVEVDNGCFSLRRTGSKMDLSADSISLSVYDLGYGLEDRKLTYCDSLYDFSASNFVFASKDSLYRLDVDNIATRNSGGLFMKGIHGRNTTSKNRHADAKGKVPVTWSDFKARTLRTSSVNIVRTVLQKRISIDSIFIDGDQMTSYRDARYQPKKEFPMPQESILRIPLPVHIGMIDIKITYYNMEIKRPEGSAGRLRFHDTGLKISRFSNDPDHTTVFRITPRMGKGQADVTLTLKNDRNSSFTFSGNARNVSISDFGGLIGPLFGVSATGSIQNLKTSFSGNKFSTKGNFCMLYDNLKLEVDPQKTPIAFLSKHSKAVSLLEGGIIHRQNPRKLKKEPFTCSITAKRDPMKNYGAYIVSTLLNGVEQTVLNSVAYKEAQKMKGRKNILEKKDKLVERIKEKKQEYKTHRQKRKSEK